MGKTSKPLTIEVHESMVDWPEVQGYRDQGHIIRVFPNAADIIFGPQCWRMDQDHREYFDLAISEARKVRYSKEGKNDTTGDS